MPNTLESLSLALADRYRLDHEIGAGGMATVYLAHDVRHDREVAVKVLRPELAAVIGAERFLAEIKTTAHLQHPHILPLFDSGAADGFLFYVMPFVQGESLRHRLERDKQLPIADALRIATQVAGALDYAHRHKVIHRDIKPENILLHDGAALVADFGIALAVTSAGSTRMTETGMSLGTPHYMSPEQAMGEREIGPQSDIYALGAVTYEMLVGEPPFTGPTAQAIVAKVVTEDPRPLIPKRHTIPVHVDAAVLTAIEKLPADRFASAAEFASALGNPAYTGGRAAVSRGSTHSSARTSAYSSTWRRWLTPLLAGVTALAIGLATWSWFRLPSESAVTRFALELPADQAPVITRMFTISPDGAQIAYIGPGADGATQIWIKARDRFRATPLAGTAGAGVMTFSPDSRWIAFMQAGQLRKLSVLGGSATTLADSVASGGLAWMDDGTIVYIVLGGRSLRQIADAGGTPKTVWQSDSAYATQMAALPGSRGILYTRCPANQCVTEQDLWALDLESGDQHAVQVGAVRGTYVPTGHVLYVRRDGGVFALPFDARKLAVRGAPIPVLDSVAIVNGINPLFAVSDEGTLLTRSGTAISAQAVYEMFWIDQAGRETAVDSTWRFRHVVSGGNAGWRLSRDGRRLVIGLATQGGDDIWVKQLPRGPLSRVTFDSTPEFRPRWTPHGESVLFGAFVGGNVMRRRADGTGSNELVLDRADGIYEAAMTPDGEWLVYRTGGTVAQVGSRDIYAIRIGTDTAPVPVVANPAFDEAAFDLSPDGRWIAYESNETGRKEIYVRPFPNADSGKWQASNGGGTSPLWARNGRELYFIERGNMNAVSVSAGSTLTIADPRVLFRVPADVYAPDSENYTPFDVGPDGRFIMARRLPSTVVGHVPMLVVENWFTELREKVRK